MFEKQGSSKIESYQAATFHLAIIYGRANDLYKCQDVVDKFVGFAKAQGSRKQERQSLDLLLPTCPLYEYLEGRVSRPALTYEKIAHFIEAEEKEKINKEIGERRTRLGAKIGQVTLEVKREILKESPLEDLYRRVIDWTTDDDLRRTYEEKLLQRCYDVLLAVPATQKEGRRQVVAKLAQDMVIIKHPFKLAWDIYLEWQDCELIDQWDANILREYQEFFPTSGLGKLLKGFMTSEISPFPPPPPQESVVSTASGESDDDSEDDDTGGVELDAPLTAEDRLLLMTDGIAEASLSIIAHRLMGTYFAFLDEHESVVELARAGRELVQSEMGKSGLPFQNAFEALTSLLGTALVFYQSPKNHPEAKALFEDLLQKNPTSTPALIGIGLIFEEEEDFPAAIDFLDRALKRDETNTRIKAEAAWVRALNGDYDGGADELVVCLDGMEGSELRTRELRAQTQYRIGVCIWNKDPTPRARKDRSGAYGYFLAALKSNLNYAPAYTSLGIFYSDYSKDKKRARKCFQKAFELSSSEIEAAERLARAFAEQGDWDLVEAVSQRVVDSGKVRPAPGSKKRGFSWPFAALGIAELNKQDYARSIVSFQSALRITPDDYHSWVGLGESYHNSGRYMAATKAFTHAERFEQEIRQKEAGETWFAKYMLANVKRELGDYSDAIASYRSVLEKRGDEYGVLIALLQALIDSAWDSVNKGLFGQAAQLSQEAIGAAQSLIANHSNSFNLWKALGDACSIYSLVESKLADFPHQLVKQALKSGGELQAFDFLSEVDAVSTAVVFADGIFPEDEQGGLDITRCLQAAILCNKRALYAASADIHAQAVAHYNLGWAEFRAHICLSPLLKKMSTLYLKAAVQCFKRAIELEAGNPDFWNALGVATSDLAPRIAQHAFVRSLFLNERSAHVWTNLGALYLIQNDWQLANETFTRAQSTDPDYAHAWVGQGLVALLFGDPKEARMLFTHAMEISDSSSIITKQQYSSSTFDNLLTASATVDIIDLIRPIFGLNQLASLSPEELPYQHLASLFLERISNISAAVSTLHAITTKVEADYEITEAPLSMARFALAKADLARLQLAECSYNAAIDSAETALELTDDQAGNELSVDARRKCRLSAYLTLALSNYHNGVAKVSLEHLEAAIQEAQNNPDCVCLLAQVLWALGTDDSRGKARDQLYECIENHPGHIQSVLLLGTISLLDGDLESLEAVNSDLVSLRTNQAVAEEEQADIGELLRAMSFLSAQNRERAVLTQIQSDVVMFPYKPHGWGRLANVEDNEAAADMSLKTAVRSVPPRGNLDAADLSAAYAGTGNFSDAQKATLVAPWNKCGWKSLTAMVEG